MDSKPLASPRIPGVQRKERKARKLDRKAALDQHVRGLSTVEIAKLQALSPSTVWRFLERTKPQQEALERFKGGRADAFANLQARSLNVQGRILESLDDDRVVEALTPHQKTGLIAVLNAQMGTAYDKERLERGQSTSNVSMVHRMMAEAFERAGKSTSSSTLTPEKGLTKD